MAQYTASSLIDIAETFETLASDQLASKRWQSTAKEKRECDIRAEIWRDAAEMLRETQIIVPASEPAT
jgi:hypothetical protein